MELKRAIEILEEHNRWQRDVNVPSNKQMVDPKQLGVAIDLVISVLKTSVRI